jgi:NAD(P)-dependent dehydrogenase (short-subunit alcohol dehydrogenase family)
MISKKLLAEFTRAAAASYAPWVAVNAVGPGPVLPPPGEDEDHIRERAGLVPLPCRCRPRDVAAAVVFLAESDAVTGQVIFVDGGQHLLLDPRQPVAPSAS